MIAMMQISHWTRVRGGGCAAGDDVIMAKDSCELETDRQACDELTLYVTPGFRGRRRFTLLLVNFVPSCLSGNTRRVSASPDRVALLHIRKITLHC